MNIEKLQYIELNIIGIVLLSIMLIYNIKVNIEMTEKGRKYFNVMLCCNIFLLIFDTAIYLFRGHYTYYLYIINNLIVIAYFILHFVYGYFWLRYCLYKLYPEKKYSGSSEFFMKLPILFGTLIILESPYTHWLFSIDEQNSYERGPLLIAISILVLIYWLIGNLFVTYEQIKKTRIRENSLYLTLQIFPIPTLIGNIIQLKFYGFTIVWLCSAISTMILFIYLQNNQVSKDMLTGLFNRRQTNIQLAWEQKHISDQNYSVFLIMFDIDNFKYINDNFGHMEGDRALCFIAKLLKASCRAKDFVARLGGDEFLIIGHCNNENEINEIIENIKWNVNNVNQKHLLKYEISISFGYSLCDRKNILTPDQLITEADQEMYICKQEHHKKEKQPCA